MASRNGATRLIWGTLQAMLLFITAVKMLAEIALMLLLGRGLLALLAGPARAGNPVYRLLQWLTDPLLRGARAAMPGFFDACTAVPPGFYGQTSRPSAWQTSPIACVPWRLQFFY